MALYIHSVHICVRTQPQGSGNRPVTPADTHSPGSRQKRIAQSRVQTASTELRNRARGGERSATNRGSAAAAALREETQRRRRACGRDHRLGRCLAVLLWQIIWPTTTGVRANLRARLACAADGAKHAVFGLMHKLWFVLHAADVEDVEDEVA